MSKGKGKMNLEAKLIKCKMELDKIALREPRTVKEIRVRLLWERVRIILVNRYDRLD
jgi:hypothetical protein|tara:strand:+ start:187 stop:357 length:171 start_codon:yes stop_codon:yes gene_type:complete